MLLHYYYARRPNLCRQLSTVFFTARTHTKLFHIPIFSKFNHVTVIVLACYSLIQEATPPGHLLHHFV